MKNTYPDYYHRFSCVADACEATCCAGWQIVVDEESLKNYAKVNSDFSERIKTGVDFEEGVFLQKEKKRCAFLNEKNLCDMYTVLGEGALCETCTRYPRHIEEFENVREHTLSVSCPEVARILLGLKEPVRFLSEETPAEEEIFDDFDPMLYEVLAEAREKMLGVLQDRTMSIGERAAILWIFITEFQEKMDEGMLYVDDLYAVCEDPGKREEVRAKLTEFYSDKETVFVTAKTQFSKLFALEILAEEWEEERNRADRMLYQNGAEHYAEIKEEYDDWCKVHMPERETMAEQLIVYFLFTYFCGAVYDEYVASKVKLSVLSVFYIDEMLTAQWILQEKQITHHDIVRVVYRFSRELEHSDENLCAMDRLMEEL
ncbi:MAG: FliB family protein [Lachnospiraceae bacterium]|nr:FliB family protein [Lachnospiraceae bacterium]